MKTTFDYLETAPLRATVCDKEGIVLYQNVRSREMDGDAVGKNLFDCHNEHSAIIIKHMLDTGGSFTSESVRDGKRRLFQRMPWYDEAGEVAGLIELGMDLPKAYPVMNHDLKEGVKPVCEHSPAIDCPCPKDCPRHGKCCACVAHHREHGNLPLCLRDL